MSSDPEPPAGPEPILAQGARETPSAERHTPGRAIRIVVVDDHPMYREGIVRALGTAGFEVVGEGSDGKQGLVEIRKNLPDVALVDVSMPGVDGIDLVGALARNGPDVPVVLLSAFSDEPLVLAGLQAGAAAYVTKEADRDEIVRAVRAAASPALAPGVLAGHGDLRGGPRQEWIPLLTWQEHRLLQLARVESDKAHMALMIGIDEPAVRRSLSAALAKLGADTLPEAIEIALHAGLIR